MKKTSVTDKVALESGKISLNALREKHGLPAIKDRSAEHCLAKFNGVVSDGSIGLPNIFSQDHGRNFHPEV